MSPPAPLETYFSKEMLEAGIDEVGRGCLLSHVFAAAVIWPPEVPAGPINDSKKLSERRRLIACDYIKENAVDFAVSSRDEARIDEINILQATFEAMHSALDGLSLLPDHIIVDGNNFRFYVDRLGEVVPHSTVVDGDSKYVSIAAASILAKVARDRFVRDLCEKFPILKEYDVQSNVGYGTPKHLEAIRRLGITRFHRQSFGPCRGAALR
ncbi:MAG: ribonuclease HII [Sulfobacillus sp.]